MTITTTKPTVVESTAQKIFDQIWMKKIEVNAKDVNGECHVRAVLAPYMEDAEGVREEAPFPSEYIKLQIDDVFSKCEAAEQEVATVTSIIATLTSGQRLTVLQTAILQVVDLEAKEQGLI